MATMRSRVKSFKGKKVDLTQVRAKIDPMTPTSSLSLSLSSLSVEKESECNKKVDVELRFRFKKQPF